MNKHLQQLPLWLCTFLAGAALLVNAAGSEPSDLLQADEYSKEGLQMECQPVKTKFVIGESVILRCSITNSTGSEKRIRSYLPRAHFRFIENEMTWLSGSSPEVTLQIRPPIKSNEFEILLPAHTQLDILLTLSSARAQVFRGMLVYDPALHGGGFFGSDAIEKARRACLFSKTFEYEVTHAETKR